MALSFLLRSGRHSLSRLSSPWGTQSLLRDPTGLSPRAVKVNTGTERKKASGVTGGLFSGFNSGDVLLSHTLAHAVPSGLKGLTSVFGMGTGVTPSLQSPKRSY